jgi:hypothetical protein
MSELARVRPIAAVKDPPAPIARAETPRRLRWLPAPLAVGAFLAVVAVVGYRTYRLLLVAGQPDAAGWGLVDFRDAIYFPVVAFLDGSNPYASAQYAAGYPVGNHFPIYLPLTLILHLPFGMLPFAAAELAYFITGVALILVLAYLTLRFCEIEIDVASLFTLAALILVSAPGQWNAFLGQCTAQVAAGMYAALYFARRRPWLAAIGVAVASFKPSSGVPFALLMLARGDVFPVIAGAVLSAVVSAAAAGVLVYNSGGITPFIAALAESYASFDADPLVNPATSPYRIDVAGFVGRLFGSSLGPGIELAIFALVIGGTAYAIRRLARAGIDPGGRWSASMICVAVAICTYHQLYDQVLLALPLAVAATAPRSERAWGGWPRWLLIGALALPALNYLVDGWTMNKLRPTGGWWLAITSADGAALLLALLVCWLVALRFRRDPVYA